MYEEEFKKITKEIFPSGMEYTLSNLLLLMKLKFKATQIELDEIKNYIKEYREHAHYFYNVEDYTEGMILPDENYMVFINDALVYNSWHKEDERLYNLIIISTQGEKVIKSFSNVNEGIGDFLQYTVEQFLDK